MRWAPRSDLPTENSVRRPIAFRLRFLLRHEFATLGVSIPTRTGAVIDARACVNPHFYVRIALALCWWRTTRSQSRSKSRCSSSRQNENDQNEESSSRHDDFANWRLRSFKRGQRLLRERLARRAPIRSFQIPCRAGNVGGDARVMNQVVRLDHEQRACRSKIGMFWSFLRTQ
jgi:hypothetical protein